MIVIWDCKSPTRELKRVLTPTGDLNLSTTVPANAAAIGFYDILMKHGRAQALAKRHAELLGQSK